MSPNNKNVLVTGVTGFIGSHIAIRLLNSGYSVTGTMRNLERSKSDCIRPGNVWVDIQQVFYRMQENVNGCPAQKPLKAIERIVESSSAENDIVTDFFAHGGTTLLACEMPNRPDAYDPGGRCHVLGNLPDY